MEAHALIHLSQGNGVQKTLIPFKRLAVTNEKNVRTTSNDILIQQELKNFFIQVKGIICAFNTGIGSANKVSGSSITLNNDLPQNVEIDTNHITVYSQLNALAFNSNLALCTGVSLNLHFIRAYCY